MNNFALGKYMPLNSPIHRMDPRAKIMAMLIVLIAIFFPAGFLGYAIIAACAVAVVLIAKLSLNFVWRSMKPMLFMLLFLLIVNILVLRTGGVSDVIHRNPANVDDRHHDGINRHDETAGSDAGH